MKTTVRYHLTPIRMVFILINNKFKAFTTGFNSIVVFSSRVELSFGLRDAKVFDNLFKGFNSFDMRINVIATKNGRTNNHGYVKFSIISNIKSFR